MNIVVIVGARPQFIKLYPFIVSNDDRNQIIVIHTGQHYDYELSKVFFDELRLPVPDFNLGIGSGRHGKQTGEMIIRLEETITTIDDIDWIVTFGDTNSTISGCLAAVKLGIKTAHIEAGLRSFNRAMPEEINRIVSDHVSNLLFCPTSASMKNLTNEGLSEKGELVGDVMIDALMNLKNKIDRDPFEIIRKSDIQFDSTGFGLLTMHRAENTCVDQIKSLKSLIETMAEHHRIVFPIHPRTRDVLVRNNLYDKISNIKGLSLLNPLSYFDFQSLLKNAEIVLTDSGGIQKEAYHYSVPCITLRNETEWVETVEDGWNTIVGTDIKLLDNALSSVKRPDTKSEDYGSGTASRRILKSLEAHL